MLNVFRLLSRLGGTRVALASDRARDPLASPGGDSPDSPPDISGIAARDQGGRVQVFLCSHHDDWDVKAASRVEIRVSGLEPGLRYRAAVTTVDDKTASSYSAWVAMGEPQKPSREQKQALAEAALLRPRKLADVVGSRAGGCSVELVLASHAVCLVELEPVRG